MQNVHNFCQQNLRHFAKKARQFVGKQPREAKEIWRKFLWNYLDTSGHQFNVNAMIYLFFVK